MAVFRISGNPSVLLQFKLEEGEYRPVLLVESNFEGLVNMRYPRSGLPLTETGELRPGVWSVSAPWDGQIDDDARESLSRPQFNDITAIRTIAAPTLRDGVLDFGEITFDSNELLDEGECFVVGQLVHRSGVPIADTWDFNMTTGTSGIIYSVLTDADGYFVRQLIPGDALEDCDWRLYIAGTPEQTRFEEGYSYRLTPTIRGRIVDCGRVVVNCARVNVSVMGWASDDARLARAGKDFPAATLRAVSADVTFRGYEDSRFHSKVTPQISSAVRHLPPGPYTCGCVVHDLYSRYEPVHSSLLLKAGDVANHRIELRPAAFVLLRLVAEDGSGLDEASFKVTHVFADGKQEDDPTTYGVAFPDYCVPIPVCGVSMEVTGHAKGWEEVTITVPATAQTAEVVLLEYFGRPAPPPTGALSVSVTVPEALLGDLAFQFCVRRLSSRQESDWISIGSWHHLTPGDYEVQAVERVAAWGYPNGVMSGPISVTVESDKTTSVVLPDVASPPWPFRAKSWDSNLTCEGQPFSYEGIVRCGTAQSRMEFHHGSFAGDIPRSCALIDGDGEVPLELIPPTAQDGRATYRHDFECRLEVRVTRGGKAIQENIDVIACIDLDPKNAMWGTFDEKEHIARAHAGEGKPALLWLPPGKAEVTAYGIGAKPVFVEIAKGRRAVVEIEAQTCIATFEWDQAYEKDDGACWLAYGEDGKIVEELRRTGSLELRPGVYTVRPMSFPERAVEMRIEVKPNSENRFRIPFVAGPEMEASLLIPYPAGLTPSADGYIFEFEYFFPALGAYDVAKQAERMFMGGALHRKFTNEGVVIASLPVNAEIVIFASIAGKSEANDQHASRRGWHMAPRTVKLATGRNLVADPWRAAVVLDPRWCEGRVQATFTPIENPLGIKFEVLFPGDDYWQILPAGEYNVRFECGIPDSTLEGFEIRVSVCGEGRYFEIPPEILAKLKETGLYDPDDD
ncbi:MAG: hypothetical protein IT462_07320 [Planctomycetes bacterium]|nr:hypothetical protein [Planctomycetota bacterium]